MPDQLTIRSVPHQKSVTNAEWLLREAVRAMHAIGEEAEERFDRAVLLLSEEQREVASAAAAQLEEAGNDPMLRWSINRVISRVNTESAVVLLHQQGARVLAPRDPAGGCEQPTDVEELVSVMAVEGLAMQAAAGLESAIDALLDVLSRAPSREVSRVSASALVNLRPDLESQVRTLLGVDAGLLDLRAAVEDDLRPDGDLPDQPPDDDTHGEKPPLTEGSREERSTPLAGDQR